MTTPLAGFNVSSNLWTSWLCTKTIYSTPLHTFTPTHSCTITRTLGKVWRLSRRPPGISTGSRCILGRLRRPLTGTCSCAPLIHDSTQFTHFNWSYITDGGQCTTSTLGETGGIALEVSTGNSCWTGVDEQIITSKLCSTVHEHRREVKCIPISCRGCPELHYFSRFSNNTINWIEQKHTPPRRLAASIRCSRMIVAVPHVIQRQQHTWEYTVWLFGKLRHNSEYSFKKLYLATNIPNGWKLCGSMCLWRSTLGHDDTTKAGKCALRVEEYRRPMCFMSCRWVYKN